MEQAASTMRIRPMFLFSLVGLELAATSLNAQIPLWQIGRSDTNSAEFALAPDGYHLFERDGVFIVGRSEAARDWPYVHPGPDDEWAGSTNHTFRIVFGLTAEPPGGEARLTAIFTDDHPNKPPRFQTRINGHVFEQALPKGHSSNSIEGQPEHAEPFRWQMKFPARVLKAGDNEISFTSLSGSWALYDSVALETPPGLALAPISEALTEQLTVPPLKPAGAVTVTVDAAKVLHEMRGGIGASWHAIETPIPYGVRHATFTSYSHGGSGWGAYPPAEDERAWQQIYHHAEWLGLDWNRVEIEQRIYEPERGVFTFDSPEMRILYRILDWHQKHQAEVFFQQMWCNVPWLAYPQFRDDAVGRVHSAPVDLDSFADGLATLMEHLIKHRGYSCIRWLCINNEPGESFSWWQAPPNQPLSIGPGLAAVRKALDKRGLALPLSGPDTTTAFPTRAPGPFDYLDLLGAYDFHDYSADFDFRTRGHIAGQVQNAAMWVEFAHRENKPVFLSEFGTMAYGWLPDKAGPGSPPSMLAGSELVLRLANAGVDGFNRWSFLNRGDLDGQWQLVDTWDPRKRELQANFTPHPNSYFCLGLLSRFTAKHPAILSSRVQGGELGGWQRVFCAAFRSPAGNLSFALVNDAPVQFPLTLVLANDHSTPGRPTQFYRYRYAEAQRNRADVQVNPEAEFSPIPNRSQWEDVLAPNSLTIYSTLRLEHHAPGLIEE